MIKINLNIDDINLVNSVTSKSLPLSLCQPIKSTGQIDEIRLINDIIAFFERSQTAQPYSIQIGVDEVGRGPLYGSVVVSAVVLPTLWSGEIESNPLKETPLAILTDSKKLTEKKREKLFEPLKNNCLAYIIVEIPAKVIDQVNIFQATMMGMRLACEHIICAITNIIDSKLTDLSFLNLLGVNENTKLSNILAYELLIDGNKIPDLDYVMLKNKGIGGSNGCHLTSNAIVKGDGRHTAIAAASVLAKVSRDNQLIKDGLDNPGYGLEGHKGYPTKAHIEAINSLGVLEQHRRSFKPIKEALINQKKGFNS